jgi:hypothetical protein
MKHRTITIGLVAAVLLSLMVWSFGSSAAKSIKPAENNPVAADEASAPAPGQGDEEDGEEVDADLGKWASRRIDRDEYLRLRDEYIARKRGIEPGRPFDPSMRGRAIEQMERQEKNLKLESLVNGSLTPPIGIDAAWTPIGPTSITNGQALSGGNTAVSGRVTAIVVDPADATKVYIGTAQGGVWRSLDGGTTWLSIFDGAQSLAIGALALAPSDPTILYVGTGEFNGCGDCFFGVGLYRIDTVTTTPSLVGPINPQQAVGNLTYNIFNGRGITKIVVDPTNAATIFVSTGRGIGGSGANALNQLPGGLTPNLATRGLWRSTNATADNVGTPVTFQKLVVTTDGPSVDNPATGNVDTTDIVMEPGVPNNLLVAVIGVASNTGGIYRTTNALAATPTFALVLNTAAAVRTNLTINKVGAVVTAYAATSEAALPAASCPSTQLGAVRKQIDPFNLSDTWATKLAGGGGFCGTQCFYDIAIAVNPNDANEVYLGGNARGTCSDGMKKSTNGGTSFFRDDTGTHADSHALFFDGPGSNIFAGNDGGVWKKLANNTTATAWINLNNAPLNTLQFESIAVHPTDRFLMIGGTQDNGTEYQITSIGNWSNAEGGDGGYSLIDQSATNTTNVNMYHTFFNQTGTQIGFDRAVDTTCLPNKNFWPTRGVGFVSPDNQQLTLSCDGTADYLHNGITITDNVLFYAPMALGPGSPNTVYFGSDRLYRSIDRGDNMTVVSQPPIFQTNVGTPAVGSPISSIAIWPGGDNVRMVGLQNGQVWATSTGSATLVNITSASFPTNPTGSPTNKFVGRAVIDPNNKNVAYVGFSFFGPAGQGVWKITNLVAAAGAAPAVPVWTAAGNGIPSVPINGLVVDPLNSNNIYAGTDIGVYVSTDAGASWSPFGTGLPRSAVFDLQIQPSNRILRAGTHGRGVWETPLISPAASTVQFTAASDSVNESQVSKTITVTRAGDTSFPASVNYATSDTSGANNCNVNSGSGSSRCDYIATSGTLNFAANELSKNILIPIVDDAYLEGNETFTVTLSAAGGNNVTIGAPGSISIRINDNEVANGTNQIDTSSYFVREHYIDFLNREPDTAGQNFWTNNIDGCTPKPACTELTRINTSGAFFLSVEFQETGYLVYRFYKAAYGDDLTGKSTLGGAHNLSVPIIRLNEFLPDTQRIGQGVVVNVGNWQQQLEDNKQAFAEEFVQRSRFLTAYPLNLTAAQFVDNLNTQAASGGVKPLTTAQRDQLVSDLSGGIKTRGQVLRAVAENQTLFNAESNRAFVLMQYFGYLRRNPNDPQDSDYTGYDFWLGKLNQFGGNFVNAEMVKSFLVSGEYRQRFGG